MDKVYLTDEIDIVNTATDINGVLSTSTQAGVRARVEEKNRLITDRTGKEVTGSIRIILASGADVFYESKIKVKKIAGFNYFRSSKEWQIKQLSKGHGFTNNMIEVWV